MNYKRRWRADPTYPYLRVCHKTQVSLLGLNVHEGLYIYIYIYRCIYVYNHLVKLEWDEKKNAENKEKHGLDFRDAEQVFDGETATFLDDRCDYGEDRYITIGLLEGRLVVIVHTLRGENIRVISMRKGNTREEKIYRKRLEKD